ncbi:uncharacterized protein LOC135171606 [Diachasmimorpha longicaudata]|uniref:uncharacterized protein LOC135171606 n=1 Tax=Diachasmimorpha longicaudata TaxID=58733 RepID=UPI0030B897C5
MTISVKMINYHFFGEFSQDQHMTKYKCSQSLVKVMTNIGIQEKETSQGLTKLVDATRQHLAALKFLDKNLTDETMVIILERKIHEITNDEWNNHIKKGTFPSLDEMLEFLSDRAMRLLNRKNETIPRTNNNYFHGNYKKVQPQKRPYGQAFAITSGRKCSLCGEDVHPFFRCEKFRALTPTQRLKIITDGKMCINCLRDNHQVDNCHSRTNCWDCKERHNTLLHKAIHPPVSYNNPSTVGKCDNSNPASIPNQQIVISAKLYVIDKHHQPIACRTLLDTCSSANFITEKLATQLGLPKRRCIIPVGTLNDTATYTKHSISAQIQSISDPEFFKPAPIDMILGSGPTLSLFCIGQYNLSSKDNQDLYLQKTRLGWVLGGDIIENKSTFQPSCHSLNLDRTITQFWEIEELPKHKFLSREEHAAENHFVHNCTRDSSGRLIVALPFNAKREMLGESRNRALQRFYSLERKLDRDPQLKIQYSSVIQEYLDLKHMSETSDVDKPGFYLPHHAVIKESSLTTKVRVVFDGSAKSSSGISLNESLLIGPTIQDSLFTLILRFRQYNYVLTGDIEKMYRQFLIREEDRNYQRILWRNSNGEIITYQLNTVTFGLSCAPFLAIRALQQLATEETKDFPTAARILKNDLYVDDLLTGFDNIDEAISARQEITALLTRGGLNLRQWASNDFRLLQGLPAEHINKKLQLDSDKTLKTLGISWNSENDCITYKARSIIPENSITKRKIFSEIASIFDPLGLLGPIILKAKCVMQKLWEAKVHWDESIPSHLHTDWNEFCKQLPAIDNLHFTRHAISTNFTTIQIHGFADASNTGYGACIYLRSTNPANQVQITLLCSKSRVSPMKYFSTARLELCAAHLLSKLYKTVQEALTVPISETILWSDSIITLHWIKGETHKLKTFVANRVNDIQDNTKHCQWRYVSTNDNPADPLSRGQYPIEFIQNTLWHHGPSWLTNQESQWPKNHVEFSDKDPEAKIMCLKLTINNPIEYNNFTSFNTLIRSLAFCFRFKPSNKALRVNKVLLTLPELEFAHHWIIKEIQGRAFLDDLPSLKDADESKDAVRDPLQSPRFQSKKLRHLTPVIDKEGIIRMKGRLNNAPISFDQKHPIILPKNERVTDLIIEQYHRNNLHSGIQTTLYALRQKYWVLDGRNQVRKIIRKCVTCSRANPLIPKYTMGDLPENRVTGFTRPFINVGVDYCGPFYIKEKKFRNRVKVKAYVAVFICMATKAVHLELVSDMTTAGFLGALRRFVGRRGKPISIHSDNGTNFVGANNELKEIIDHLQSAENNRKIHNSLINQGIDWKFTPPLSPHFGGIWEAAVKCFKHHLVRVIGSEVFTFEEMNTLIIDIEAILNSRPLTPMSSDPTDILVLTPGHFLIGDALTNVPEKDFTYIPNNRLSNWEHIQKVRRDFWVRWYKEYLNELNIRRKWNSGNQDIQLGSIVILKEDNLPPMQWRLGRIVELHPGKDNIVRVASIKTGTGILQRNLTKIAPLPVSLNNVGEK